MLIPENGRFPAAERTVDMAKRIVGTTPGENGFRMPAEFEERSQVWMIWPERTDNWRSGAKPAQEAFCRVAEAVTDDAWGGLADGLYFPWANDDLIAREIVGVYTKEIAFGGGSIHCVTQQQPRGAGKGSAQ